MRTKKFNVSLAPFNTVKVFDSEFGTMLRTLKVTEGTIIGNPTVIGNDLTVRVQKDDVVLENVYVLPLGLLKKSTMV
jgi:hypothetical protein